MDVFIENDRNGFWATRNIVSTVNLDCKLDLKAIIALQARNAEYNPKISCEAFAHPQDDLRLNPGLQPNCPGRNSRCYRLGAKILKRKLLKWLELVKESCLELGAGGARRRT